MRLLRRRWRQAAAAAACLLTAVPAGAHLSSTGLGPVCDSLRSLLLSPGSLAPLIGLGLLAGLRGAEQGRLTLFCVTGGWLVGGGLQGALLSIATSALLPAALCLTVGLLVAADQQLSRLWMAAFAVVIGTLDGAGYAALEGSGTAFDVAATGGAVFVLTALTASVIVPLQLPWLRMVVRVVGGWLAALGVLLAGWAIRLNR
jgi:urease accessory protein